jgi:hypothetical protein
MLQLIACFLQHENLRCAQHTEGCGPLFRGVVRDAADGVRTGTSRPGVWPEPLVGTASQRPAPGVL